MRKLIVFLVCLIVFSTIHMDESAQNQTPRPPAVVYLLKPASIFDGESAQLHNNWVVLVRGEKIEAVGPASDVIVANISD